MAHGVGLSVGATNFAAVVPGRSALTRSSVLTRFAHRPPEVGVPSENRNLDERGLILTDFVDRVGDPVDIVAADGSTHRGEAVLADALRAMLYAVCGGRPAAGPVAVTHPAHWRPAAVDALRRALAAIPEFQRPQPAPVVSDAVAALTSLQNEPGVPTRGVIALCDFGGTGTSITLLDADSGYTRVGETVRDTDLSGDLVDQALLTHVLDDLSAAGSIDLSSTSAMGSLSRLRAQCRGAKERLSTAAVTSLVADLSGHRSDVRLTRTELDEVLRGPLTAFTDVLQETLERNGVRELSAVASVGGGARIPAVTTTLSERLRVPVVTTGHPELAAAEGGGLAAVRGTVEEGMTALSAAPEAAAAVTAMAPEAAPQSGAFGALAWSDAEELPEVPEVMATDPDHYPPGAADVRPQMQFGDDSWDDLPPRPTPWYRRPLVPLAGGVLAVLAALVAAVLWVVTGDESAPAPASTTAPPMTATPRPATPTPSPAEPPPAIQAPPQTVQAPPPVTRTITEPPPSPEPPPPSPEPPPPTTTEPPPPPTTQPPPTTTEPPASTPPPWSPTAPYPTIPGLPWVPAPQLPGQPAP